MIYILYPITWAITSVVTMIFYYKIIKKDYKFHEAIYLLKYDNERAILQQAYDEYTDLKKNGLWVNR